jgi:hypothetical protein
MIKYHPIRVILDFILLGILDILLSPLLTRSLASRLVYHLSFFIVLSFHRFIVLSFYHFIILSFYHFIILSFYRFAFLVLSPAHSLLVLQIDGHRYGKSQWQITLTFSGNDRVIFRVAGNPPLFHFFLLIIIKACICARAPC